LIQNLLIIFKEKKKDNIFNFYINTKFSKKFNVEFLYISEYLNLTTKSIVKIINYKIRELKIDVILFEGDHVSIIDKDFVDSIDVSVKKGLISFDDNYYHAENIILSSSMDFALVTDEYLKIQLQEIGLDSHICLVEDDKNIFKDYGEKKKYDVLFFGKNKTDRKHICSYLESNGIKVKIIKEDDKAYTDHYNLAKVINQSKIVLCPTKTESTKRKNNVLFNYKFTFQHKGRPYMSGLCNSLAISEPFPAYEMIFKLNELPIFYNLDHCLKLIKKYLSNSNLLKKDTEKFHSAVNNYVQKNSIENIEKFICNISKRKTINKIRIPFWYQFLFFKKNLLLRYKNNHIMAFFFTYLEMYSLAKYKLLIILVLISPTIPIFLISILIKKNFKI
jgi:hypothetical protein